LTSAFVLSSNLQRLYFRLYFCGDEERISRHRKKTQHMAANNMKNSEYLGWILC